MTTPNELHSHLVDVLKCGLCTGLAQDAVTTQPCAHTFCKLCLQLNVDFAVHTVCPSCSSALSSPYFNVCCPALAKVMRLVQDTKVVDGGVAAAAAVGTVGAPSVLVAVHPKVEIEEATERAVVAHEEVREWVTLAHEYQVVVGLSAPATAMTTPTLPSRRCANPPSLPMMPDSTPSPSRPTPRPSPASRAPRAAAASPSCPSTPTAPRLTLCCDRTKSASPTARLF
eukprot:PhM_4_TR16922/c0_g1_i1/m.30017